MMNPVQRDATLFIQRKGAGAAEQLLLSCAVPHPEFAAALKASLRPNEFRWDGASGEVRAKRQETVAALARAYFTWAFLLEDAAVHKLCGDLTPEQASRVSALHKEMASQSKPPAKRQHTETKPPAHELKPDAKQGRAAAKTASQKAVRKTAPKVS